MKKVLMAGVALMAHLATPALAEFGNPYLHLSPGDRQYLQEQQAKRQRDFVRLQQFIQQEQEAARKRAEQNAKDAERYRQEQVHAEEQSKKIKEQFDEQQRQEVYSPRFRARPDLVLVCESMRQDRTHITVQIVPSEGVVRIDNDTLPITKVMTSETSARNEFGHEVMVPYIAFVWADRFMLNNADKAGAIIGGSGTVNYGNGLFRCIGV